MMPASSHLISKDIKNLTNVITKYKHANLSYVTVEKISELPQFQWLSLLFSCATSLTQICKLQKFLSMHLEYKYMIQARLIHQGSWTLM